VLVLVVLFQARLMHVRMTVASGVVLVLVLVLVLHVLVLVARMRMGVSLLGVLVLVLMGGFVLVLFGHGAPDPVTHLARCQGPAVADGGAERRTAEVSGS